LFTNHETMGTLTIGAIRGVLDAMGGLNSLSFSNYLILYRFSMILR